jgi:integrase
MEHSMTKIRLKYINEYVDKSGKLRRYFRRGNQRHPLPGLPGSAEFMTAYQNYLGTPEVQPKTITTIERSFGRLITAFYGSREFKDVTPSSRRTYARALEPLAKEHGHREAAITHQQAERLIAEIGSRRPAMANLTKSVLRRVYDFGVRQGLVEANPFISIRPFKTGSHHTWSEGELRQYEQRWPLGTRERLAYELLLRTGQRVGDIAKARRSDIENGELHIIQQKTGQELYLPIVPELERAMKAYPAKGLSLIGTDTGKPVSSAGLSQFMRTAIEKAGLPGRCKPHGLRKATMRRLAEDGKTEKQIAAVSGHKTLREVQRYTEAADQRRLAKDAMK